MKQSEVLVKVSFDYNPESKEVLQYFDFEGKNYIHNPGFIIHQKFESKIIENTIPSKSATITDMIRGSDRIIVKYRTNNNFTEELIKPRFYKVSSSIPDYEGCRFCKFLVKQKNQSICSFQDDKILAEERKKCKFFKQKHQAAT